MGHRDQGKEKRERQKLREGRQAKRKTEKWVEIGERQIDLGGGAKTKIEKQLETQIET